MIMTTKLFHNNDKIMKNKIFYGEYTLKHWIKLMLTGDIVLPEYQRHFVWKERDVKRLLVSLREGQFVQPVTIALYNDGVNKDNIILDGQQRLTSILLSYLGYFPDKKKFETEEVDKVAHEDDSALDESDGNDKQNVSEGFLWQYSALLKYGNTKKLIASKICRDDRYLPMNDEFFEQLDDSFYQNTYLGFSYVVPRTTDISDIQKFFAKMFRNINYFGKKLEPMDSRKSLYYQDANMTNYFEGKCTDGTDVLGDLRIVEDLQPTKIDFVRYLAILSQFTVSDREDAKDVMVGYSAYSSRESFYADYVSYILGIEQEEREDKFDKFNFDSYFSNNGWKDRFDALHKAIDSIKPNMPLKDNKSFSAWFEADFWLFGLMNQILFKGKRLKGSLVRTQKGKNVSLKKEIDRAIADMKSDSSFIKNSNRVSYIRQRLVKSNEIYSAYVY